MANGLITSEMISRDRMSELPELVRHRILSFLTIKEAALTSLLSKAWREEWLSLPSLDLGEQFFLQNFNEESSQLFIEYIDRLFVRRYQKIKQGNGSFVQRLYLHVPSSATSRLDWWLSYAFRVLKIKELEINRDLSKSNALVAAKYLRVLCLSSVTLDQKKLDILATNCQVLESLSFHKCESFRSLKVVGFHELIEVRILCSFPQKRFEIDDANLQRFLYDSNKDCKLNVVNCRGLRCLKICGSAFTDETLSRHLAYLSNLEDLHLGDCSHLKHIKISGHNLKHLTLRDIDNVVAVQINACKLKSFVLSNRGDYLPCFLFDDFASENTTVSVKFPDSKSLWNVAIARFLTQLDQHSHRFRVNAVIKEWDVSVTRHMKRNNIPPLHYVKNLVLCTSETQFNAEFVDALSWVFTNSERVLVKPIVRPLKGLKLILKFKYKEEVDAHVMCDHCNSMACWWHCLQQVTIVNIRGAEECVAPLRDFFVDRLDSEQEIVVQSSSLIDTKQ